MGLSSLFSVFRGLFRAAPVPLNVGGDIVPVSTSGSASLTQSGGTDTTSTQPEPDWIRLCRPLTQHFESCRLFAYWDPNGKVWTCGWGDTGPDVDQGTIWTQAQADARLNYRLYFAASIVDREVRVELTPQQKAALTDLLYNVGPGRATVNGKPGRDGIIVLANGQPSTLLRQLNAGDYQGCTDQFPAWDESGGEVLPGLQKRRAAERSLFLTGAWH